MAGRRRTNTAKKPRGEAPVAPATVRVRAIIDCAWDRDGAVRQGAEKDVHPEDAALLLERGHVENA
jgi:hypothetical protein